MQTVLSDYNCEGQARAIFRVLDAGEYLKLIPLELASLSMSNSRLMPMMWSFGSTVRIMVSSC